MASSTEEHTVPESQNEIQASTCSCEPAIQKRFASIVGNTQRAARSRGPMVLGHWVHTGLEVQAVVSVA